MMKEIHKTIQLKTILILLFIINIEFWSSSLSAAVPQLRSGETIDMIVAIVGNEIIMKSTLEGEIMLMAERDKSIDITDKKLRQSVLDELINRKILITKAEEDSITVSDDIVEERWEIYQNDLLNYFGSIERIEAVYKKSINRLKLEVRDEIKKMLLAQQLENQHFGNVV
ncbi:MAG: SurA N-terminal domain-containing protein, partial [Bacteroidetes bacterium]|nr:SurA N-terminal domain-containing protein [Bacteroidota bacterium]